MVISRAPTVPDMAIDPTARRANVYRAGRTADKAREWQNYRLEVVRVRLAAPANGFSTSPMTAPSRAWPAPPNLPLRVIAESPLDCSARLTSMPSAQA